MKLWLLWVMVVNDGYKLKLGDLGTRGVCEERSKCEIACCRSRHRHRHHHHHYQTEVVGISFPAGILLC